MSWDAGNGTSGGDQCNTNDEFATPAATNGFSSGFEPSRDGEFAGGDADFAGGDADDGNGGGGGFGGECYNCGQTGHPKSECPNPRVERAFTGTCRLCEEEGHRASDCPSKPPLVCMNCKEEGHSAFECESSRKVEYPGVEDVSADTAWEQIRQAAVDRDLDDILEAADRYFKAAPDATYPQIEKGFRAQGFGVYLICLEKELINTYTNMDLQGNLDKKYTVTWRLSDKPSRPSEKEGWPESPEENLVRLEDAGKAVDRGVPKCSNCEQLGHTFKACPEEKQENTDKAVVSCFNCSEVGHRMRDCPVPRVDKFACRNCKQSGHTSKECPEPRSAEGVECKKCNEIGHFSHDCPQGGGGGGACHNCGEEGHRKQDCTNEKKVTCRNCDEVGHVGRDCPKPRDYSRVTCSNCDQKGHTKVRCKEPLKEEDGNAGGDNSGDTGYAGGGDGDFDGGNTAEVVDAGPGNSWESAPSAAPVVAEESGRGNTGTGGW